MKLENKWGQVHEDNCPTNNNIICGVFDNFLNDSRINFNGLCNICKHKFYCHTFRNIAKWCNYYDFVHKTRKPRNRYIITKNGFQKILDVGEKVV